MAYYKNISLEKGMYGTPGKSFTQVLEELDSSESYRGTPLEGLDAYQRQLLRREPFQQRGQRCPVPGICGPGRAPGHGIFCPGC